MKHFEVTINDTKVRIDQRLLPKDGIFRKIERLDWSTGCPEIVWSNRIEQYRDWRSDMWNIWCTYAIHFPNGTYYIGHTKNPFKRISTHKSSNRMAGVKLRQYKRCRFDMLGNYCEEHDWIKRFINSPKCLNKMF